MVILFADDGDPPLASLSVPAAIVIGLCASFVQSLGLTIQRKSHMQNALQPDSEQRSEWRRKTWLVGFAIFVIANIGGTVFQIGALPIVMLAPLGAVSLLFNALLARFLLDDFFSKYMLSGTGLIAVGAVLIGYFGAINEPPHSLDELLALYGRPAFVAFVSLFALVFIGILGIAHLAEWQLHVSLFRPQDVEARPKGKSVGRKKRRSLSRRWSAPSLAPVAEVSESSSGIATPNLEIADDAARRGIPVDRLLAPRGAQTLSDMRRPSKKRDYGSVARSQSFSEGQQQSSAPADDEPKSTSTAALLAAQHDPAVRRTCLGLAVAYGGASGTLSGACLLLAKSGVELLELTISGKNQFDRWQSWFIIIVLLIAALLQLWYLNKSLRLASPPLVCPLAFCFYNTSSIALGLVYFNQVGALPISSILAVIVGTGVLLAGVWIVSLHRAPTSEGDSDDPDSETTPLLRQPETAEDGDALPSESPLSPNRETSERLENAQALLANAGGIAGPHLPPPSPIVKSPDVTSPPAEGPTSPKRRLSGSGGSHHRRTRSAHASLMGGLGLHMPGLPLQPPPSSPNEQASRRGSEALEQAFEENTQRISPAENSAESTSPNATRHTSPPRLSLLTSPRQKRRGLYDTLMERGLSIGLSPSSPGFHVGSSFEVERSGTLPTSPAGVAPPLAAPPPPPESSTRLAHQRLRDRIAATRKRRSFSEMDRPSVERDQHGQ